MAAKKAQTPAKVRAILGTVTSTGHAESPITIVLQGKMPRTVRIGRPSVATPARRKSAAKVNRFSLCFQFPEYKPYIVVD